MAMRQQLSRMSHDVACVLMWTAEPKMVSAQAGQVLPAVAVPDALCSVFSVSQQQAALGTGQTQRFDLLSIEI